MSTKYTSAPWTLNGNSQIVHSTGTPADIQVAIIHEARPSDARLMTKAPELLECLDKICTAQAAWESCMINGGNIDDYNNCKQNLNYEIYEAQALIANLALPESPKE